MFTTAQRTKVYLTAYRGIAFSVLGAIATVVVGFCALMFFYSINRSWIGPTILSPSSEKILPLTGQLVANKQAVERMQLERLQTTRVVEYLTAKREIQRRLSEEIALFVAGEMAASELDANHLRALAAVKDGDVTRVGRFVGAHQQETVRIAAELSAGLITKTAALQQSLALQQASSTVTDGRISAILTKEKARGLTGSAMLEMRAKQADIDSALAETNLALEDALGKLAADDSAIEENQALIRKIKESPYYRITTVNERLNFAFVPYENSQALVQGATVYDCVLQILFCAEVGNVKTIYGDEQVVKHPLFRFDLRGQLIELELTDPAAARSKVLFMGAKPLFV